MILPPRRAKLCRRRRRSRHMSTPAAVLALSLVLAVLASLSRPCTAGPTCDVDVDVDVDAAPSASSTSSTSSASSAPSPPSPPPSLCGLYLAESTAPGAGLGVFAGRPLPKGTPLGPPDVVVQLTDPDPEGAVGLSLLLRDYLWDGQETGGQYEGQRVYSALPGLGMAANGHLTRHNALPRSPDVDEAGAARTVSPGAGAFTHYHNHSFYTQRPVAAGGEIFLNYGRDWFRERGGGRAAPEGMGDDDNDNDNDNDGDGDRHVRPVAWLRDHGMCLDGLVPGKATAADAGRGAFASRSFSKGEVVAPVPVAQIPGGRAALRTVRARSGGGGGGSRDIVERGTQLLLNYCYGHPRSSVLLFPYGAAVNLVNHGGAGAGIAPGGMANANAALRWSNSTMHRGKDWPATADPAELARGGGKAGLMLELVALRDIGRGEEVLMDYGDRWERAWERHQAGWTPAPDAPSYTPSYVMDDVAQVVRTEDEQRDFPYGDNLITSCFYRYSDHASAARAGGGEGPPPASAQAGDRVETTAVRWEMTRGIFDLNHLRPCSIMRRHQTPDGRHHLYTVLIRNRYGLGKEERIPRGAMHVVNHVPRHAIRFSDKLYTTDQHLPSAFRHEIALPEGTFPEAWLDLEEDPLSTAPG